jgi:aminobutyraldehyde dehydrogenase
MTILPKSFTVARATGRPVPSGYNLPPYGHFIDGRFTPGSETGTLAVINPATGSHIADVVAGSVADVDRAVASGVKAQKAWGKTTPRERSEILHRIADAIEGNRVEFEKLESLNTGKPAAVSEDDISSAIDVFRFMAGATRAMMSLAGGQYVAGNTSLILREPIGVVGVITPWNYPLLMAAWKIAPILGAGNSVVLKPSEQTPLATLRLAQLLADVLPAGLLNIVTGTGQTVGRRIAEHPDIALVAITGSVNSGRAVAAGAAASLKRVHLELGGKAPVIIYADADLEAAASGIRTAGFWNSGQECGAACRIIVHESVAKELVDHLVREVSTLTIGAPDAGLDVEIGPLVSKAHYLRVLGYIDRAKSEGAIVALGGHGFDEPGYFVAPTVLTNVAPESEIATSEVFGPIVSVETFCDETEVIERANGTPYGLAASIWTTNAKRSVEVPALLDFGTVWVNAHLVLANEVPWAGFKGSGYGRDLSLYALDDFSRTKHVMLNHS